MRVALGADHAGFSLKEEVKKLLGRMNIPFEDFGTTSDDSVDYPEFAARVAREVASGSFDRGVLLCGSGIGMAIAANKVPGIRAAQVTTVEEARLSREHNDANVLAVGSRFTGTEDALRIVDAFLATDFAGGRHQRRVDQIARLERLHASAGSADT